jgi:hypothetical protein
VIPPGVAILKYEFEDGTGTKVTDATEKKHDATFTGSTAWSLNTEGRNGIAASFTAADAAIALPANILTSASGVTISAWVKLTANTPGNRLFDIGSGPSNHIYFTFNNGANAMEFGIQASDGEPKTLVTPAMLPLNVWKHVTVELSTRGARIYVDGWQVAKDATITVLPSALGATNSNWIGKSQIAEDGTFAGLIDSFYIDDNPISAADRRQRAWPKTDYSVWHFDDALGTTAVDSSDNKRDGTLMHMTAEEPGWGVGIDGGALALVNTATTEVAMSGQHVRLPDGILQNCTSGMTVATWIRMTTIYPHMRVFDFGVPGTSNADTKEIFGRTMGGWTKHWCFGTENTVENSVSNTDTAVTNAYLNWDDAAFWKFGQWYHVAAVRDGQLAHVYIDGVQTVPTPKTTDLGKPNVTLNDKQRPPSSLGATSVDLIGSRINYADSVSSPNTYGDFNGRIDEFLLSCRAYTADEIKLLAVKP